MPRIQHVGVAAITGFLFVNTGRVNMHVLIMTAELGFFSESSDIPDLALNQMEVTGKSNKHGRLMSAKVCCLNKCNTDGYTDHVRHLIMVIQVS